MEPDEKRRELTHQKPKNIYGTISLKSVRNYFIVGINYEERNTIIGNISYMSVLKTFKVLFFTDVQKVSLNSIK